MSMEMKALKSILAVKGLELPTDVEAENPVSEFISEQFRDRFPENEMITLLRDLFVHRANTEPIQLLKGLQLFNQSIVNFSMKEETRAYIKELTEDPDNANTDE
ncbi:hypothetical protein DRQ25_14570 [Candidatus Fermentibacteria bacterium]|nr:MAG: hypothetical protein DRQ25_14570 [Candidatus Fermentibacteria bacterium]